MNIKEKTDKMSDDEKLSLLSENGMIVKRPIVLGDKFALVGFKESEWQAVLGK
ncbi:MAG: ArsC/Spx/MgsR family protein [Lachnoanaerobaculum saburreum]